MPRVAVLADIHGNVPALEAVLADLDLQATDEVLVGGDLVGRGPEGSKVVAMVRKRGWRSIRGNHEDYLLSFRRGETPEEWRGQNVWAAADWMAAELTESDARYLEALPLTLRSAKIPALRLVHGTPESNCDGIGPWTSDARMLAHLGGIAEDVLVCAHTHRPLLRRFPGDGRVVNVGSVGLPFNGDRRAQYAVLDDSAGEIQIDFRKVDYDLEKIFEVYSTTGFLASGGVTAQLLRLELEHAAPFVVPFLYWSRSESVDPTSNLIEPFLEVYSPERQREFFRDLRRADHTT
jgi:diadenosine tetraphosphatase ApaH/serine/threonine PP2A family protein phosphatase